jgi:hypothetical protein
MSRESREQKPLNPSRLCLYFLASINLRPEDGGSIFLRNDGITSHKTVLFIMVIDFNHIFKLFQFNLVSVYKEYFGFFFFFF